jgi:hypothetical protein
MKLKFGKSSSSYNCLDNLFLGNRIIFYISKRHIRINPCGQNTPCDLGVDVIKKVVDNY